MATTYSNSLSSTLDELNEALFYQQPLPTSRRVEAAKWIASRQGQPGSYANMFAPAAEDFGGIRLFTGEWVRSRAGISHILGEESCRVIQRLGVRAPEVTTALERAVAGLAARVDSSENSGYSVGFYCCGTCTSAYWRQLATGLLPNSKERLKQGLAQLKSLRLDDGKWRRFPFFYTCLALIELESVLANDELAYTAPRWERLLPRLSRAKDRWSRRRLEIGERVLKQCK